MELDHVLIAVADLEAAARELEARYGLASTEGGRHPGWGTANRIVPLGSAFLELVAVVDDATAAQSAFGSWVARARPVLAKPLGWAVRTDRVEHVARRLGLVVGSGSRVTGGSERLHWRIAGVEQAAAEPSLPFFIEWGRGTPFPGRASAPHRDASVRLTRLLLDGNSDRLAAWLGAHDLPLTMRPGNPAVRGLVLTGDTGEIALNGDGLRAR